MQNLNQKLSLKNKIKLKILSTYNLLCRKLSAVCRNSVRNLFVGKLHY